MVILCPKYTIRSNQIYSTSSKEDSDKSDRFRDSLSCEMWRVSNRAKPFALLGIGT